MIFHFCSRAEWSDAQASGAYAADSLATEGFIHCSDAATVLLPANAIAVGRTDLVLLEIDPAGLDVRYEGTPEGVDFPHVYGPVPVTAVTRVHEFPCHADGTFALPDTVSA
jgi:uncharacterized protein (DUF952 family)